MISPLFWSQRLLAKGALIEETYQLFSRWDFGLGTDDNLKKGLSGRFNTLGWELEVSKTIGRRVRGAPASRSLIVLVQNGLSFPDWRDCWRLWIGATEEPFSSFALHWLFGEHESGRYAVRSSDLLGYAQDVWHAHSPDRAISSVGLSRLASDLIRTAAQLGMLTGNGPSKTFAPIVLGDAVTLFYTHLIADLEGSSARVTESYLWRLAYMTPADVHSALLRLHQYKHVDYQVAGSLVQLGLPARSALAYAEGLAA